MSTALFDLVLLWKPEESDNDYSELQNLLKSDFSTQFLVHSFTTAQEAIEHIHSNASSTRSLIVLTKLGTTDESLGETLIKNIRRHDKRAFIILHSHKACADPDLR
jgi:hypothetical protein